jgi:DNA-binding HxlR family transcriptional regulator
MNGFSKTLAIRLELQKNKILKRKAFNKIHPRVEYQLTAKGQKLVESVNKLFSSPNTIYRPTVVLEQEPEENENEQGSEVQ